MTRKTKPGKVKPPKLATKSTVSSSKNQNRTFYLCVFDLSGSGIELDVFKTGKEFDTSYSDLKKLQTLKRPLEYYIRIVGFVSDGNKVEAGLSCLYIKITELEYKRLKIKSKEYRLEKSVQDVISYSQKSPSHEQEWNTEPNHGVIPPGKDIKTHFTTLYGKITKTYKAYMSKFDPAKNWKELAACSSTKNIFFHCSSKKYEAGDLIKGYWDKEHVKDVYSGAMGGAELHMEFLEESFEKLRPSDKSPRKGCIYAFEKLEDAKDWQKKFHNKYVYAVEPTGKFSIHDMNAIDRFDDIVGIWNEQADYSDSGDLDQDEEKQRDAELDEVVKLYWAGKPCGTFGKKAINEVLISGAAKVFFVARFH